MDDMAGNRDEIAFSANFRRYPATLTARLTRIAGALAGIRAARILPAAEDQLRSSAMVGTIHYSTLIEGNELPRIEAERAAKGQLSPDNRAKIELVNYVEALNYLDEKGKEGALALTPELILELHGVAMKGLGSEQSEHFKPHHVGAWRDGIAVVADQVSGEVFHQGPPAAEVAARVRGLCSWAQDVEQREEEYPPSVIVGVVHYAITDIHPFADGNGRVARLLATAQLMRQDQVPGHLFSFERYYAEDREAYYEALRSVRRHTLNMEAWLEYFLEGLAQEYERVAMKIQELEGLGFRAGGPVQLSATQQRGLAGLGVAGVSEFRRLDYERHAEVSRSQAASDLRKLVDVGLLEPRGSGPDSRYRFRREFRAGGGRGPRTWTDERIEAELVVLVDGRRRWPRIEDFRSAGKMALYQAVQRQGGSKKWAERLGLER
jgi:Fic family protein